MNLWLRLLSMIVLAFRGEKINPISGSSRLRFRVWPHDLDTSLHMNNGRYWTLMDLGRMDVIARSGIWRPLLKNGWIPVVSAAKIRFRRELRLFQRFTLESRILAWGDTWVVFEQRVLMIGKNGEPVVSAVALVRAGLYDRKARRFLAVQEVFDAIGLSAPTPALTPEVEAFLAAEDAMKKAA